MTWPRLSSKQARIVLTLLVFGSLAWVVVRHLGTLPAGISASERTILDGLRGADWLSVTVLEHILYFVPTKFLLTLDLDNQSLLLALRAMNGVFAFAGLTLYYLLARNWWSQTVALACTILFATSAWFLTSVRLLEPDILALAWLPLLLLIFLKLKHESKWWQIIAAGGISGLAFYVSPILAWLSVVLIATAVHYSMRLNRGRLVNGWLIFFGGFLLSLVPLGIATVQEPSFLLGVLGINQLNTVPDMIERTKALAETLLLNASHTPFIQNLPLLDIATITLATYGLLRALTTAKLGRSTPVLFVLIVSLLITILTASQTMLYAYLLPIIYLLVARGLNQLMSEWYKRFPRNPSARIAGAAALILLVGITSLYNVRVFYTAWARNPQVRDYYAQQIR